MHHDLRNLLQRSLSIVVRAASRGVLRTAGVGVAAILAMTGACWAEKVTIVQSGSAAPYQEAADALVTQLQATGNETSRLQLPLPAEAVAGAVADGTRVFVAVGTEAALWLHERAPSTVGLVYCMVADPEGLGLHEGRGSWGVSTDVPLNEQFGLMREATPKARSVGVLYRSGQGEADLSQVRAALPDGWRLEAIDADGYSNIADAINALMERQPDIVWTSADPSIYNAAAVRTLLLAAVRRKIPVFGFSPAFVKAGALVGLGIRPDEQGRQAAELVDDYLRGNAPADNGSLGVKVKKPAVRTVPPRFEIAINLIVSEQLRINLPAALIERADQVFKPE